MDQLPEAIFHVVAMTSVYEALASFEDGLFPLIKFLSSMMIGCFTMQAAFCSRSNSCGFSVLVSLVVRILHALIELQDIYEIFSGLNII